MISCKSLNVTFHMKDEFINGDYQTNWNCEKGCPSASSIGTKTDLISFTLKANSGLDTNDSWSKIYTKNYYDRLSYGTYSSRFQVNRVPSESGRLFVGIALWQFAEPGIGNEVMLGYFLRSNPETQLLEIYSQKDSNDTVIRYSGYDLSRFVDTFHTLKFEYQPTYIKGYFDNILVGQITDTLKIPTKPMSFIVGARLAESPLLASDFITKCDYTEMNANII